MHLTSLWSTEQLVEHMKSSAAHPSETLWGSEAASWIGLLKSMQHWKCDVRARQNTIQQECRTPGLKSCNPNKFCDLLSSLDYHLHPATAVSYLGERKPSWIVALKAWDSTPLYYTIFSRNTSTRKNLFQIRTDKAERFYPYKIYVTHFLHEKEQLLKCINPKTNGWAATCWKMY